MRRSTIIECVRMSDVTPNIGEAVRGKSAPAASRALRPPSRSLAAAHKEHARRGVKL